MDIIFAVSLSIILSALIGLIEVKNSSKSKLGSCLNSAFLIYLLVLGAANTATTVFAFSTVNGSLNVSKGNTTSISKPLKSSPVMDSISTLGTINNNSANPALISGVSPSPFHPVWFWSAFIGVFGFEILLKNINITFADKGVLSINDWISKAREMAVGSAIDLQAHSEIKRSRILSNKLRNLDPAELTTHFLNLLGSEYLHELQTTAAQDGADLHLLKALALASESPDEAEAIYNAMKERTK